MAFIGVDLGSTNVKAALYDGERLSCAAMCSRPVAYKREGVCVEFDADLLVDSVLDMLRELGNKGLNIDMITLTGQAESLVLLGKNCRPLRPAISWMDERSAAECQELSGGFTSEEIYAVTGQKAVLPTWPATKILYLTKTEPETIAKTAKYIMIKDYLAFRLSGTMAADKSIATFTFYFDIRKGGYWQKMMDLCGIKSEQLPPLVEPCTILGPLDKSLNLGPGFAATKVNTGTLDHFAGMIGNGIVNPGAVSESTGTVLAMAALVKLPLMGQESAALHYGPFPGTMVLLPVAESGGVCLEWFKNKFLPDIPFKKLDDLIMKRELRYSEKLLFLPYLVGTNAPEFASEACGVFFGLRSETDSLDMARSVMEGVALLLEKNLAEMRRSGLAFSHIVSSGGGAKSDLWSQIKADICGLEIRVPQVSEAACFGSAIICAVSGGMFTSYEEAAAACVTITKRFTPGNAALYGAKKAGFAALYEGMLKTAGCFNNTHQAYSPITTT
jgi:xylulokinase